MSEITVSYIATGNGNLSIWLRDEEGKSTAHNFASDHKDYKIILELLRGKKNLELKNLLRVDDVVLKAKEEFVQLADSTQSHLEGKAKFVDGQVFINDVPIHGVVSERIEQMAMSGLPIDPVLRFLENVLMNPSSKSQQELYDFLANRNLPLTEDGCFLAYKRIREDWLDIYSGTIDNSIGKVVSVPREQVDSNRSVECSHGLHVGGIDYVRWYGSGQSSRVVVVKVNPQHCVSVPKDHSHQKLRTCQYEVLYELTQDEALKHHLYNNAGDSGHEGFETGPDSDWGTCSDDIEQGWDRDYESWSTARLRETMLDRDPGLTKDEVHDMDRAEIIDNMCEIDEAEDEERETEETLGDNEGCDTCYCSDDRCTDYCELDDYQDCDVEPLDVNPLPRKPAVGEVWRYTNDLYCYPESAGKLVLILDVVSPGDCIYYSPSLDPDCGRSWMDGDSFLKAFTFVTK
jgi:hypothetical protein